MKIRWTWMKVAALAIYALTAICALTRLLPKDLHVFALPIVYCFLLWLENRGHKTADDWTQGLGCSEVAFFGIAWLAASFKLVDPFPNHKMFLNAVGIMGFILCFVAAIKGLPQPFKKRIKEMIRFGRDPDPKHSSPELPPLG